MGDAIVAVGDVVWKCFTGEEWKDESGLRDGKRANEVKQGERVVKVVYDCGVRLVKALRNVDVEAMM
jgi:hypothetical protein